MDDIFRAQRFNTDPAFTTSQLYPPDSYGVESGVAPRTANGIPIAQSRGIATLPGGIPIFKNGQVVGGIGVFFPGKTGFATEENSAYSMTYDPSKPDRTLEAEWMAYAAVGGTTSSIGGVPTFPVTQPLGGVALPAGFGLPSGRIDLVGISLDVFGPGGIAGLSTIKAESVAYGTGNPDDGADQILSATMPGVKTRDGLPVPEGWIVLPHNGDGISASDVVQIVNQGINQANLTRAAIRLPLGTRTKMVFAVSDRQGNIVGLYREPDATVFSIDVAVAKARNTAYYANAAQLQPQDQVPGVPAGTAFEARTFRYLALPRFPESVSNTPPGPFSQLNDGGVNPLTGLTVGSPLPASAYQSVLGYDAFNPGTNFRAPTNILNQNGVVFFPGAAPLYKDDRLIGGLGVSGDGVDQDDVMTRAAQGGYYVPTNILRADQVLVNGIRLPYQKTNRNPQG
ncbi:MAG: heme-binding protein [Gemmataceae bacterium]